MISCRPNCVGKEQNNRGNLGSLDVLVPNDWELGNNPSLVVVPSGVPSLEVEVCGSGRVVLPWRPVVVVPSLPAC